MAREERLSLKQAIYEIGLGTCSFRSHTIHVGKSFEGFFDSAAGYIGYNYDGVFNDDPASFFVMYSTFLLIFLGLNKNADAILWADIQEKISQNGLDNLVAHLSEDELHRVRANFASLQKYFNN
jgi:hypothetical protein